MSGSLIVGFVVLIAIIGPLISPHDPVGRNLRARFQPPGYSDSTGTYTLGTDQLGRDILSRIIAGSRVSVLVGIVSVLISGTIGVTYGLVSGFFGGFLDTVLMRVVDAILSIPFIVLVVAISGVVGAGLTTLILILGFAGWVTYARVIRGEVLKIREMEYVIAAYALGQHRINVMFRHILPNVISSAIVLAAVQVAVTILAESSLSFLGLGVKTPTVTWGLMLADGKAYINKRLVDDLLPRHRHYHHRTWRGLPRRLAARLPRSQYPRACLGDGDGKTSSIPSLALACHRNPPNPSR